MNSEPSIDVREVCARIRAGKPIRRTLAGGGRLHIDRPVPFLCVYRIPIDRPDLGTAELVRPQASHLVASGDPERFDEIGGLVAAVIEALTDACGACLLLEVWSSEGSFDDGSPGRIRIHAPDSERLTSTVSALGEALRGMQLPVGSMPVDVVSDGNGCPPRQPAWVMPEFAVHAVCLPIGLEVSAVYRSEHELYPFVLRALTREFSQALVRGFFEFARVQTPAPPRDYHALARRRMLRSVREADHALAEIEREFDFLLDVTPVNAERAWQEFQSSKGARAPKLKYRMLEVDPELVKRRLYNLELEHVEDPVIALLLRDKRRELDRQLSLLEDRDSPRFLAASLELYGGVDNRLMREAHAILEAVSPNDESDGSTCNAEAFAIRARAEIAHYRSVHPKLSTDVELRADVPSLIVTRGSLWIPQKLCVPEHRVEALLQHEIGTHIVTAVNGSVQPLRVLASGLAGYEALQEGLAMFAEHVVGGLDASRLRLVAARAIAVRRLIEGAEFPEVVSELSGAHGLPLRAAFGVVLRVFRGGGLTKDATYLRGLLELLEYLARGGQIEPLLVGKIAFEQVGLVEELLNRQLLRAPLVRPRWIDFPDAATSIERARTGVRPIDLIRNRSAR